jgi:alcohol dehydrogenase
MKAALLKEKGQNLQVEDIPAPLPAPGGVKIRVIASHILSFTQNLFSGDIPVQLPTPYIPGPSAIGIVEELTGETTGLEVGQKVFCNPYITSKEQIGLQDGILKGWFGLTENASRLLEIWKHGSFAEQTVYPVENVTPFDGLDHIEDAKLSIINYLCIAYGGMLKGDFRPGQSVLINGASGNLGSAAVLVALAMGASSIYAIGRNAEALNNLKSIDSARIRPVVLEGTESGYKALIASKVGKVDMVLDALGTVLTPYATASAISALRNKGTAVLIGGVFTDIPLNYYDVLTREITITGSFMYPASAPIGIINMIKAKTLQLEAVKVDTFNLEKVNEAVAHASRLKGLHYCALLP